MTDFDSLVHAQVAAAPRAWISLSGASEVTEMTDLEISLRIDVNEVSVLFVGPYNGNGHDLDRVVCKDRDIFQSYRSGETEGAASDFLNGAAVRELQIVHPEEILYLDLIELMIASNQHSHRPGLGGEDQRFDQYLRFYLEECGHVLDSHDSRRVYLPEARRLCHAA